jgi:hypothetical protein
MNKMHPDVCFNLALFLSRFSLVAFVGVALV